MSQTSGSNRIVRVAAGQGFWGDWLEAPRRQVEGGPVDYLMLDYLAEVTMSILQKQKERDPSMGYARDFIGAMESVLPAVVDRGVKVIANAGGVIDGARDICGWSDARVGAAVEAIYDTTRDILHRAEAAGVTPAAAADRQAEAALRAGRA